MTRAKRGPFVRFLATSGLLLTGFAMAALPVGSELRAETIDTALARAYQNSPIINASRASLRATNEGVPQARSGYRPRINATADIGKIGRAHV